LRETSHRGRYDPRSHIGQDFDLHPLGHFSGRDHLFDLIWVKNLFQTEKSREVSRRCVSTLPVRVIGE
jgi:hypothetical protein